MLVGLPRSAHADAVKERAQELMTDGNALARAGDFGIALVKFRTAYELYPSPKLLLNMGTSLRHMGRYAEAIDTYERYLADRDHDPERYSEVQGVLDELDRMVGSVEVETEEDGVRVSLDGGLLRDFERRRKVRIDPGPHTLVAEKDGREPTVKHFTVTARGTKRVLLLLAKPGEAASDPVPTRYVLGLSLASLGGAAVVVGAVLGAVAIAKKSEGDDHCPDEGRFGGLCSPEGADLNEQARTLGSVATATFITGFVLGAGGLALALAPSDDDEQPETARLLLGPAHVGVELRW
jgi:tetratricopeptide (TPR) repeat protein